MKSKTLITMAVASTFGWSAALAAPSHEVITPFSPNESGEQIFTYQEGFSSSDHLASVGSISDEAGGTLSGSVSDADDSLALGDESATDDSLALGDESGMDESLAFADESLDMDESLAFADDSLGMDESLALADEGIYSNYYLVSWTPVTADSWDIYLIDTGTSDALAAGDEIYFVSPAYEVVSAPVMIDVSAFPSDAGVEASG
jgi:hypothetical protein